jgi:hypothetical protein
MSARLTSRCRTFGPGQFSTPASTYPLRSAIRAAARAARAGDSRSSARAWSSQSARSSGAYVPYPVSSQVPATGGATDSTAASVAPTQRATAGASGSGGGWGPATRTSARA